MDDKEILKFMEKANEAIKQQNLFLFSENIGVAKYIAPNEEFRLEVLENQALGLYQLGQYTRALEIIDQLLPLVSNDTKLKLLHKRGICLVKMGDYSEALGVFHGLVKEYPDQSVWGLGKLGWTYIYLYQDEGQIEYLQKAEEYCRIALDLSSGNKELYKRHVINLGNVEWLKRNYEKALNLFLEAADLDDGDNPNILNNIAAVYVNLAAENYTLCDKVKDYLYKAEEIAERVKNEFELGQTYLIRARFAIEIEQDFIGGKDFYLVAFDRFVSAHSFPEALKTLNRILALDQKLNKESIELLGERFKTLFGKGILTKDEEVFK